VGQWYVCVLHHGSSYLLSWAVDGHVMHCGIIGSCQSAATSRIVKALLVTSLTHVSSAIVSTRPLPFINIVDIQGLGVVGARIIIDGRHMATTQQQGTYHLDSMKPGSYRLSVEAPRMTFEVVAVKVTPNTPQLPSIIAST